MHRVISYIELRGSTGLVLFLFLIQFAIHVPFIDQPPSGYHQWRQTQTLAVARNFYEEGGSIFEPRVDSRGPYSGATGMEFPIVNYTIGLGYTLFGFSDYVHRIVMLLFSLLSIWGCFLFVRYLLASKALGFLATFCLIFSPLYIYYSMTAIPDIPALGFLMLSLAYWQMDKVQGRGWYRVVSLICLLLAGLVKISFLLFLAVYVYEILTGGRDRRLRIGQAVGLIAVVGLVAVWYLYARHLSDLHHNYSFRLAIPFPYGLSEVVPSLKRIVVQWLPELYVNYAQFALVLGGLYALNKNRSRVEGRLLVPGSIALAGYVLLMLPAVRVHDYYMIPALPLLIVLIAVGFREMSRLSHHSRLWTTIGISIFVLIPILGGARAIPRFARAEVSTDLQQIEEHLNEVIPDRSALIVAARDESPSTYLYFMHRKGWSFNRLTPLDSLGLMAAAGGKYLVCDSRELDEHPDILPLVDSISQLGAFRVSRLKIPVATN